MQFIKKISRETVGLITVCVTFVAMVVLAIRLPALADADSPKMGIYAKAGQQIDLNLEFVRSDGKKVTLKELNPDSLPFIIVPAFYDCPRLCGLTLKGVENLVNNLPLALGEDYIILTYSFNSSDTYQLANERKKSILQKLKKQPVPNKGWEFLVADESTISKFNGQLGFKVRYADKELEHSSAIYFFSADGILKRFMAGVEFDSKKAEDLLK